MSDATDNRFYRTKADGTTTIDAWKLYCEAWHEAFPRSQLEPTLSPAALQIMVDKMVRTGGLIYQAMAEQSRGEAERSEHQLLHDVLDQARETLLVSIKGTPEDLQRSLGKLNLACKAHYDWRTEKVRATSAREGS